MGRHISAQFTQDAHLSSKLLLLFCRSCENATVAGEFSWISDECYDMIDLLKSHSKNLLPWTTVGRVLELLIQRGCMKTEHVWLNAALSEVIQDIARQTVP